MNKNNGFEDLNFEKHAKYDMAAPWGIKNNIFLQKTKGAKEPPGAARSCRNCKNDECLVAAAWPPPFPLSRARSTTKINKHLEPIPSKRYFFDKWFADLSEYLLEFEF